ncbi:MAG: pilus assembly protein N-terminal domain-containing protein, partial [Solobacterium sp.]|nr:pilus assembly protein N-terminal domain-containing protein [Solobacterium sp.]
SDDKIVKAEGASLQYVKPGEVTIRAAYKDNPKIYTEFKVKAFTAADPTSISLPKEVILYPDFAQTVPVEYTPYLSFHTISSAATADGTIAELAYYSGEGVRVNGRKPGSTTLSVTAGSKAKASAKVTVKSGKPKSSPYAEVKQGRLRGGLIRAGFEDLTKGYTCILGKEYTFTYGVEYKDGYDYQGEECQIKVDLSENLAATGLFDGSSAGTTGTTVGIFMTKAIKAGEATVEVVPGVKVKITVIDPSKVQRISMHRLYNPNSWEHFYTGNEKEKDALVKMGWKYEGVGWTAPSSSNTPVYRLYNPNNGGDHHYTMNKKEYDALIKAGWQGEGVRWYSDDKKAVPVYREYNPGAAIRNHNYTANKKEHDALTNKLGWKDEGIGWYGLK